MKLFTRLAMTIFIATFVPIALLGLIMRGFLSYANFTLMTVAVGLLLTAGLYMSIIRPLDELKQGINRVKQGDLDFTLEAENEDEIGELTTAFEEMRIRLRESNEEKLQYDTELKDLISNIAHDLKTPITTIRGYAEGIMDGVASTPEMQDKYVRTIYNKSIEMTGLIEELSFYAKIGTNKIPYNFSRINIKSYFEDMAEDISIDMEAKGISFRFSCELEPDVRVIADPEQLHKVISNIVGNSVKYMTHDPKRIDMQVRDIGDFVQCDLSDNGKGVDKKELSKIFERFYRADKSRNSAEGGSGIGLSIVKKIVEDHGGRIWASCEEGQGLGIHFILRKYVEVHIDGKKDTDN